MIRPGDGDTICALATAPGVGAIAVVRLSGRATSENVQLRPLSIAKKIASFLPSKPESHRAYFGTLKAFDGSSLDEALVTYFAEGRSFTGEESLEFSVHGGSQISGRLLEELLAAGARLAKPGEFTYRAYMNDRIDLVQAESILSLIEARSSEGSANALAQLKGELSRKFLDIENDLLWIGAQLEASIDFSSDGIELKPSQDVLGRAENLNDQLTALIETYNKGRILRDGLTVAFVGSPNAGKSSLLNSVVEEDRAIVTDQPGTTRDVIEVETRLEGTPVRWIDTAGIRQSSDVVEKLGVERSLKVREAADVVVVVIDLAGTDWREKFKNFVREARSQAVAGKEDREWYFFNKVDLDRTDEWRATAEAEAEALGVLDRVLFGSARMGTGLLELKETVVRPIREKAFVQGGIAITQARHVEGLKTIQGALTKGLELIRKDASPEIIAFELTLAVRTIHELLGKEFHEQVIDRIFKEFCLGK
ncbi:MAG: tRNA uridine-5-carboxymethylaminomethyl(34) synthesis GTPase MnmE [Bdellovibrionales bacterium]|nr:tRNA uridine-5-carboxymethylaminomethyl(34) synthesis GTPase MnmE [Bdellovibrionales bacterium]